MQSAVAFMMIMLLVCASRVVAQGDFSFESDLADVIAEEGDEVLGSLESLDVIDASATAPDVLGSAATAETEAFDSESLDEDDAEAMGSGIALEGGSIDSEENLDVDAAPSRTLSGWVMLGMSAAATVAAVAAV